MRIHIVLALKKRTNAELVVDADHYAASIAGDPIFPAAEFTAQLTALKTAVTNMRTAMNVPTSDTKTEGIRITRDVVERLIIKLANRVEDIANDPTTPDANRLNIVLSAGMTSKEHAKPQKRTFTATQGEISGGVVLLAQGGAKAHEWQYTTDTLNFNNRVASETTTTGKTEIFNLQRGVEYGFFHKSIISGEKTDWEGPVLFLMG